MGVPTARADRLDHRRRFRTPSIRRRGHTHRHTFGSRKFIESPSAGNPGLQSGEDADPEGCGRATPGVVGGRRLRCGYVAVSTVADPEQEEALLAHCRDARYVWNLAVEQQQHWRPGRTAPGYVEQAAQLTEARAEYAWLRAGSQTVQQQALRDFAQAMQNFFAGTHRRPTWRKAGVHEGFRQVAVKPHHVERLNRRFGRVWVPKVGWVRFRLSRPVPEGVKSYRVTRDRAGRWHVAFSHVPAPIPGPGDCSVVGIDRGVAVSAALSTGELLHAPGLTLG